jgi:hypothetical protein
MRWPARFGACNLLPPFVHSRPSYGGLGATSQLNCRHAIHFDLDQTRAAFCLGLGSELDPQLQINSVIAAVFDELSEVFLQHRLRPHQDIGPQRHLIGTGLTNREIGQRISLSEKTIKHYVTNILQKLQVRSRVEAALLAAQRDIAGPR